MREHGTRARYVHGPDEQGYDKPCRCVACTEGNRAWTAGWQAMRDRGESSFVEPERAELVRGHVRALQAAGLGTRRICDVAGVSRTALQRLLDGRDRIRHATADRLLALPLDTMPALAVKVDARQTWERVEALLAAGYSKVWIAEQIGQKRALQLGREQVTVANARLVERVYVRFRGLPPPRRGTSLCCFAVHGVPCAWPPSSGWFCVSCGYGLHECPPNTS